jgi:hypothetical protein
MPNIKAEKNEGEGITLRVVDSPQIDKEFNKSLKGRSFVFTGRVYKGY